jgi:hypothetical protein
VDITDVILADHHEQRRMFALLDDVDRADTATLGTLWTRLSATLEVHAQAEEIYFYPELLKLGERRHEESEAEETKDAIGDHNDIRDGVHAAETHTVGTPEWWTAVTAAREANDEHMAEEEREGIADFRANAPAGLREALGRQFARFFEQHPTTDGVNVSDKNPERYVETVEADIAQTRAGDGSLGIGSLKGQRQL